jgi:hypothetical protein
LFGILFCPFAFLPEQIFYFVSFHHPQGIVVVDEAIGQPLFVFFRSNSVSCKGTLCDENIVLKKCRIIPE